MAPAADEPIISKVSVIQFSDSALAPPRALRGNADDGKLSGRASAETTSTD